MFYAPWLVSMLAICVSLLYALLHWRVQRLETGRLWVLQSRCLQAAATPIVAAATAAGAGSAALAPRERLALRHRAAQMPRLRLLLRARCQRQRSAAARSLQATLEGSRTPGRTVTRPGGARSRGRSVSAGSAWLRQRRRQCLPVSPLPSGLSRSPGCTRRRCRPCRRPRSPHLHRWLPLGLLVLALLAHLVALWQGQGGQAIAGPGAPLEGADRVEGGGPLRIAAAAAAQRRHPALHTLPLPCISGC